MMALFENNAMMSNQDEPQLCSGYLPSSFETNSGRRFIIQHTISCVLRALYVHHVDLVLQ